MTVYIEKLERLLAEANDRADELGKEIAELKAELSELRKRVASGQTLLQHNCGKEAEEWFSCGYEPEAHRAKAAVPKCSTCGRNMICDIVTLRLDETADPWWCPHKDES